MHKFEIKKNPKIGDIIYVPSIRADEESSCAWSRMKKKGGYATVGFIQKTQFDTLVFVTEYGGFGIWWNDIKDIQNDLSEEYGILTRAQLLLR